MSEKRSHPNSASLIPSRSSIGTPSSRTRRWAAPALARMASSYGLFTARSAEGLRIQGSDLLAGEVLAKARQQGHRDHLGIDVDDRPLARHQGRRVTKALHRPDIRKQGLGTGPLVAAADTEHGPAVAGDQQHAVLHRAGEVVLVDPAEDRGQFPIRVLRVHARTEALHPVRELCERDFGLGHTALHFAHDWIMDGCGRGARAARASWPGVTPNWRLYSRLNWGALS